MKKGPLSNKEKEHIESFYETTPLKDLSSRMNRSLSIVQKFVEALPKKKEEKEEPVQSGPKPGDLMARNEERGVTVMTEGASMASDQKKHTPTTPKRYRNDVIHKIKED